MHTDPKITKVIDDFVKSRESGFAVEGIHIIPLRRHIIEYNKIHGTESSLMAVERKGRVFLLNLDAIKKVRLDG